MQPLSGKEKGTRGSLADALVPFLLFAGISTFIAYPVFCLVQSSFFENGRFSLALYENLIKNNRALLWNSIFTATLSSLLATILSVGIAARIAATQGRFRNILMLILLVTMVSPPFVSSLAYIQLFGRQGWITRHLLNLSLNPYNWRGVVILQTVSFAPMNILFLLGMIEKVDDDLLQAARNLGASASQALRDVMLPLIRPGILACLLLSFIRALADFGTPIVIGGRFDTVASEIYMQVIGYARLGEASALNMLIFLPAGFLFVCYRRLMRRSGLLLASGGKSVVANRSLQLEGTSAVVANLFSATFFLMMLLQYGCIFAGGFLKSIRGKYFFTWEHLERLLAYDVDSLTRSVIYAVIVALSGTLFSMLFAYYTERRGIPGRNLLDFVATMPNMIPGTCFGIGYILAFNSPPLKLTGTAAIVILNMLFRQLPNTTKICSASLSQIPFSLEEAARNLGAGKIRVVWDIVLPNLNRAFFSGFAYNFTSAMTTAGAILFLIHPRRKIAVFRLFDAINTGEYGIASLIATLIIVVALAVNLLLMRLTGDSRKNAASASNFGRAD